jgi:FkbM family methyltransferase
MKQTVLSWGRSIRDKYVYGPVEKAGKAFREAGGDRGLRISYNFLDEHSVVVDLGGYKGDFASDIFAKYQCLVYVFEPVPAYADFTRDRFRRNGKIRVFTYGLGEKNETRLIGLDEAAASLFRGKRETKIELRNFEEVMRELGITHVDVLKVNIEGGEYELLPHLVRSGTIKKVRALQVQFHDFYPGAKAAMNAIRTELEKTHTLTWGFEFAWENWERKPETA